MKKTTLWAWISGSTLLLAWFIRCQFSVDFTDEAWYIATSYRFILGDKPYVDEIFLMQNAALLTTPIYWPYIKIFGTEGIVLYGRTVFLLFHASVGAAIFLSLKKFTRPASAFLAGLAYFAFVPFSLPALSYNTMGLGFLAIGLCLSLKAQREKKQFYWTLAGASHALSLLAHPTMLPVIAFYGLVLIAFYRREKQFYKQFCLYALPLLAVSTGILWMAGATPQLLQRNYLLTRNLNIHAGNTLDLFKMIEVVQDFAWEILLKPATWLTLIGFLLLRRKSLTRATAFGALALIPVTFLNCRANGGGLGMHSMPLAILFLSGTFIGRAGFSKLGPLLPHFVFPSVFAAILISVTSYNGLGNAGVASLIASLVVLAYFSDRVFEITGDNRIALAPMALAVLLFAYTGMRTVYQDDPLSFLTHKVTAGPYKGLHTSAEKKAFEENIRLAVEKLENPNGRIVFFSHFPVGYLMTRMKPGFPTLWGCLSVPPEICQSYYLSRRGPQDVAVRLNRIFYAHDNIVPDRYHLGSIDEEIFKSELSLVEDQLDFIVYGNRPQHAD